MRISSVNFYSSGYNTVQNRRKVSTPLSFKALSKDEIFIQDKAKLARKNSDLNVLLASSITADIETRKAGKIIYTNAKNSLKAGKKVNYKNYAAKSYMKDAGETKLTYGNFDEKTGIPKKISLVEPAALKTVAVYEFKDAEHPLDSFKLTRYDEDGIYEHQLNGKKVTAFSQREYGSDIEKALILDQHGFTYIEAKVSDEEGVDPEIQETLSYSIVRNRESATYREHKDGNCREYSYNPNKNIWTEVKD